ncbi:MAG: hypothetical protein EU549_00335 [Promethearchaeota archaeon]|nr:MAG: hypothetical protein EU549_00335 [Candidatus Lokiarchaeota archaeon]
MNLFKDVVELLYDMYTKNEYTISVKKIRNRLDNKEQSKVSYEINKVLQWLLKRNYINKIKSETKAPNKYKITKKIIDNKKELELFYK